MECDFECDLRYEYLYLQKISTICVDKVDARIGVLAILTEWRIWISAFTTHSICFRFPRAHSLKWIRCIEFNVLNAGLSLLLISYCCLLYKCSLRSSHGSQCGPLCIASIVCIRKYWKNKYILFFVLFLCLFIYSLYTKRWLLIKFFF